MNIFLIQPNIRASCEELAKIDPRRAMKQLCECNQILASVEWALTGACTMRKANGQPYGRSHPHHPCVVQAVKGWGQFYLAYDVAWWLAMVFPRHTCAGSLLDWAGDGVHDDRPHANLAPLVVVRRNHSHTYVDTLEEYAALMRPYFLAKVSHAPSAAPAQPT